MCRDDEYPCRWTLGGKKSDHVLNNFELWSMVNSYDPNLSRDKPRAWTIDKPPTTQNINMIRISNSPHIYTSHLLPLIRSSCPNYVATKVCFEWMWGASRRDGREKGKILGFTIGKTKKERELIVYTFELFNIIKCSNYTNVKKKLWGLEKYEGVATNF